jgi:hypothetical protein
MTRKTVCQGCPCAAQELRSQLKTLITLPMHPNVLVRIQTNVSSCCVTCSKEYDTQPSTSVEDSTHMNTPRNTPTNDITLS